MAESKPTVYVETSIIGYLASRLSRDLITAANQQLTQTWWLDHRDDFELFVSEAVVVECSAGDPTAARKRLDFIDGITLLDVTEAAEELAAELMRVVPDRAEVDALHMAVAAVHGLDYLLTWNCTHIANATFRRQIEATCEAAGLIAPTMCTPQQLMED